MSFLRPVGYLKYPLTSEMTAVVPALLNTEIFPAVPNPMVTAFGTVQSEVKFSDYTNGLVTPVGQTATFGWSGKWRGGQVGFLVRPDLHSSEMTKPLGRSGGRCGETPRPPVR